LQINADKFTARNRRIQNSCERVIEYVALKLALAALFKE